MDAKRESEDAQTKNRTTVERTSEREVVVRRVFDAPARIVFQAWTTPELFMQWWTPKSMGMSMLSCEMDVRTGGKYCLTFAVEGSEPAKFYGRYIEVVPNVRLVWTNDEGEAGAVTTVTFEEKGDKTLLVVRDLYPSKEAFEAEHGMEEAMGETFEQLDELLVTLSLGR